MYDSEVFKIKIRELKCGFGSRLDCVDKLIMASTLKYTVFSMWALLECNGLFQLN